MVPEGWRTTKLGKVFKSRRERGTAGLPTISVTLRGGLVLRSLWIEDGYDLVA